MQPSTIKFKYGLNVLQLLLIQFITGIFLGLLNYTFVDLLKILPEKFNSSNLHIVFTCIFSGYIFGYWKESRVSGSIDTHLKKIVLWVMGINFVIGIPYAAFLVYLDKIETGTPFSWGTFTFLLGFGLFVSFLAYFMISISIKSGIKLRRNKLQYRKTKI